MSYYDLLTSGFASAYINLRVLEGVLAYAELQAAGIVPSTCANGTSSIGIDNAYQLDTGVTPCYSAESIAAVITTLRTAIGARFSDARTGEWVDWWGCSCFGQQGASVGECGLHHVVNGSVQIHS